MIDIILLLRLATAVETFLTLIVDYFFNIFLATDGEPVGLVGNVMSGIYRTVTVLFYGRVGLSSIIGYFFPIVDLLSKVCWPASDN